MDIPTNILEDLKTGELNLDHLREKTYHSCQTIDYISEPISYAEFFQHYLLSNRPCIFGPWVTQSWKSCHEWRTQDDIPDLQFLKRKFGDANGPVADCGQEKYSSHPKQDMTVADFLDYMTKFKMLGYPTDMQSLYLKDWHFTRVFPEYAAYQTPEYFCSDWLNEFWDSQSEEGTDDYRFVYIGPKGTWTPFHTDVLRSYSWSANIVGCKKWWIYPPGEEIYLQDQFAQLAFDLRSPDLGDQKKFPKAEKSQRRIEVLQRMGEVIFVPTGWHHQVFNLEDTISINHNWLNGCNIDLTWCYIKSCIKDVQREIEDCRHSMKDDWPPQCQIVLKALIGTDYKQFYNFLQTIAHQRLLYLQGLTGKKKEILSLTGRPKTKKGIPSIGSYHNQSDCFAWRKEIPYYENITLNHALFDLLQIKSVLADLITTEEFLLLDPTDLTQNPKELKSSIDIILDDVKP